MSTRFRYKEYEFHINPNKFQIQRKRILKTFQPPVQTNALIPKAQIQDLGFEPITVTGEGEIIGDQLMAQYTALYEVFLQSGSGLLHIPGLSPFHCFFEKLSMVGQAGPKVLTYQFLFLEDCTKNVSDLLGVRNFYVTKRGDTLQVLALRFGMTEAELLQNNPQLDGVAALEEGIMLWL